MRELGRWIEQLNFFEFILLLPVMYIVVVGPIILLSWFVGKFILTDNQKP